MPFHRRGSFDQGDQYEIVLLVPEDLGDRTRCETVAGLVREALKWEFRSTTFWVPAVGDDRICTLLDPYGAPLKPVMVLAHNNGCHKFAVMTAFAKGYMAAIGLTS